MLATETSPQRLCLGDDIPDGGSMVFAVEGREVAVFRREGRLFAIDDHCPHKKASLAAGSCDALSVACPWHGWQFDLRTGESLDHPGFRVPTHSIEERDGELWLTLAEEAESHGRESRLEESLTPALSQGAKDDDDTAAEWNGSFRGLVRYGTMAWVGYFRSAEWLECRHGERVLIQTTRGTEVGELLSTLTTAPPRTEEGRIVRPTGELVRRLSPMETFEQARRQRDPRQRELVQEVFAECERQIAERGLSVNVVDGELLFDGQTLVLYFLGTPTADLGRLATELGEDRAFKVVFSSVLELPSAGGCGSSSCGCSTGGGCGT
jgi:nitrite reductase/ring-hydroxylating ferredoxin subunit